MSSNLTTLDYAGLGIYLVAILALGLWVGRRIRTGADYFLAGRLLPWWAVGMSLVATDIGGTDIIGVGGAAYRYGLAVGNFEWIGCVPAMIVAAFVFIPHFWRLGIYTIPEFMEKRFDARVRAALAFCWLIFMACNLGVMLLASAKLLSVLLGWNQSACILLTAALVGVYTIAGGLAAVVYTDAVQCVVMIVGCLLIVAFGLIDVGGIAALQQKIHQLELARQQSDGGQIETTSLVLPVDTTSPFPWPGILFGLALILSPAYWIGNPAIVQRALGARSEFEAKASYIWGAVLKNIIPFIIVVPGLIAMVKFPQLKDGDEAIPTSVAALLPTGFRGIFLAAFVAALMSSMDSYLNSAATVFSNDFYKRFFSPTIDERELLLVGRSTTIVLVIWAILFAFLLTYLKEGVYAIFQTMMAFFQGPALAILMTGLLWRRATATAAFVGFLAGVTIAIVLFVFSQSTVCELLGIAPLFQISEPFLYFSVWAFLVALVSIVVVSWCTPKEPEEKTALVVSLLKKERVD